MKNFNLTKQECIDILKNYSNNYEINKRFKELPENIQVNAKNLVDEILNRK